jgi:hypothetical protein
MGQSRSSNANERTVVIRMTTGVFYGLIGTVLGVTALVVVFVVGMRLGSNRTAGPAVVQPAYSPGQPYVAQPVQPQQIVPAQPQAAIPGQGQASNQPATAPAGPPAGSNVPIGDNPRLALPDLAKTNYVLEFGEVTVEEGKVTKEVPLRNAGVKDLVIADVQTTCSCTVAAVDEKTIPPGGETVLRVTHDPQVMLNHGSTNIAHQVLINSNDPAAPWIEINMSGMVVQ